MKGLSSAAQITMFPTPSMGTVEQTITHRQSGRVKFQASYWPARLYQPDCPPAVFPGERVKVVGRQGITLLVVAVSSLS